MITPTQLRNAMLQLKLSILPKRSKTYVISSLLGCSFLILFACNNLQDASLEQRNSFVYFYPSELNILSVASAIDQDGGIITVGYKTKSLTDLTSPIMHLTKTDSRGKTVWQQNYSSDSLFGKAVKPVADGYLVVADRIKVETDQATNVTTTSSSISLFKMDLQGNIILTYNSPASTANFFANAVNMDNQGNIILLGTKNVGINNRQSIIRILKPSGIGFSLSWEQDFDLQTRSYVNGRTVEFTKANEIIWASSIEATLTGRSYASFPTLVPGFTFTNGRTFGENDDINNLNVQVLQKTNLGFATIGTNYTLASGNTITNTNFFFARVGVDGSIDPTTVRYYDGGAQLNISTPADLANPDNNQIEDTGTALAASRDGGYLLAGYLESVPARGLASARGNGGKDVLLVKIDAFGNVIWNKSYGGAGDEVITNAMQAADGGYIVTGTSTIQGFASMFIIKVNANGDLNN